MLRPEVVRGVQAYKQACRLPVPPREQLLLLATR